MQNRFIKISLITIFLLGFLGCGSKKTIETTTSEIEGIPILTTKARISDIMDKIKLIGTVVPYEQVVLYPKASGKLSKYTVNEGAIVNKDDIVGYIDRDEPGLEFSPSPVKSPISGIVLKKYLDVGATVSAAVSSVSMATPIISIGDIDKVKVVVNVIEGDIGRVKVNQDAEVTFETYKDRIFKGKVESISPMADLMSHTSKVEIVIDNKDKLIKPGLSAEVNIITGYHKNVVVIPRDVLIRKSGETYVFVIIDDKSYKRNVKVGYDDGNILEIKEGLKSGEVIAASDFNVLQEGLKVKIGGEK
jgi:multidrug efflux pump subunit AcrA (membrane-fusion protein)